MSAAMGFGFAGDQPSRGFGLAGTPATTEVGAGGSGLPRRSPWRRLVNRPYLFRRLAQNDDPRTQIATCFHRPLWI